MNLKVRVAEFEIPAENALEAAKKIQEWLDEGTKTNGGWQYYVQGDEEKDKVYSVDLDEEDEDAVLDVTEEYEPLIPKP